MTELLSLSNFYNFSVMGCSKIGTAVTVITKFLRCLLRQ